MLAAARMEEERGTRRDDGWEPDPRDHHEVRPQPSDLVVMDRELARSYTLGFREKPGNEESATCKG